MITPEQVMEELQYYISEFGMDYYIEIKNGKHFPVTTAYLSQQEKKDNLLKLYQLKDSLLGDVAHKRMTPQEADSLIMATKEEIEKLEEELK